MKKKSKIIKEIYDSKVLKKSDPPMRIFLNTPQKGMYDSKVYGSHRSSSVDPGPKIPDPDKRFGIAQMNKMKERPEEHIPGTIKTYFGPKGLGSESIEESADEALDPVESKKEPIILPLKTTNKKGESKMSKKKPLKESIRGALGFGEMPPAPTAIAQKGFAKLAQYGPGTEKFGVDKVWNPKTGSVPMTKPPLGALKTASAVVAPVGNGILASGQKGLQGAASYQDQVNNMSAEYESDEDISLNSEPKKEVTTEGKVIKEELLVTSKSQVNEEIDRKKSYSELAHDTLTRLLSK